MVYCLFLSKTFSQEAGSVVAYLWAGVKDEDSWLWWSRMSLVSSTWSHWLRSFFEWIIWVLRNISKGVSSYWFENCWVFHCLSSLTLWNRNHPCLCSSQLRACPGGDIGVGMGLKWNLTYQCRYNVIYIKVVDVIILKEHITSLNKIENNNPTRKTGDRTIY